MSRINTNIQSMVAARILGQNNNSLNVSLERLSTGLRINRGKDDPAGLIASEALRSEIKAISTAITNAERADNIVNVAEAGLQEISNLLIEMEGLVDASANEAGLSDEEVAANQLEIDSILDTINRIATSTEFQGKKLLNGELDYSTSAVSDTVVVGASNVTAISDLQVTGARIPNGGYRTVTVSVVASAQTAELQSAGSAVAAGGITLQVSGNYGVEQFSFASGTAYTDVVTAINQSTALTGVSATFSAGGAGNLQFNSTDYGSDAFVSVETLAGTAMTLTGGDSSNGDHGVDVQMLINGASAVASGLEGSLRTSALSLELTLGAEFAQQTTVSKTFYITGGGADFSIAPTLGINAMASLGIQNMSTGSLGKNTATVGFLATLGSGQANDLSSGNFATAQRIIREANTQVSGLRGRLGTFSKNTLGSAKNALAVTLENTSAAESAIRDTDFATETSKLTRAQILVQAATSTLQLANAQPRNVLALLGG